MGTEQRHREEAQKLVRSYVAGGGAWSLIHHPIADALALAEQRGAKGEPASTVACSSCMGDGSFVCDEENALLQCGLCGGSGKVPRAKTTPPSESSGGKGTEGWLTREQIDNGSYHTLTQKPDFTRLVNMALAAHDLLASKAAAEEEAKVLRREYDHMLEGMRQIAQYHHNVSDSKTCGMQGIARAALARAARLATDTIRAGRGTL